MKYLSEREIGLYIKKLRKSANISQKDVGEALKLDQAGVSRLETGQQTLSVKHLKILSKLYGTNADQILSGGKKGSQSKLQSTISIFWKEKRSEAGLTTKAVSKALDLDERAVISWENEFVTPPKKEISRLLTLYKVSEESFVETVLSKKREQLWEILEYNEISS